MDTVTLVRSAVRGLLKTAPRELRAELVSALQSGDDYASAGKPQIDWEDGAARAELVDSRAKDGYACLVLLHGRELPAAVVEAARLLATVLGQDLEEADGDVLRIARRVAPDRVISTVDPEARHGHKTVARSFDGYKGHVAVDPDSEIVTATVVTPANCGDATVAEDLVAELLDDGAAGEEAGDGPPVVYGDNAYGTGEFQERLAEAGAESRCKTMPPTAQGGLFGKDRFGVDLEHDTVTCPAGVTVQIRRLRSRGGGGMAYFGNACAACPLRSKCTTAVSGRTIGVSPHEAALAAARDRQSDPAWAADYRATRPKVERKLAHLVRRRHGGRRARVRGRERVGADFSLLAAAQNLARLAVLNARSTSHGWAVA